MMDIKFEERLSSIANRMEYPPTPNIAGSMSTRVRTATRPRFIHRRLAWSLTIMLLLLSSLMLVPPVRAAIIEFIQIGIVRIFPGPDVPPTEIAPPQIPDVEAPITATPGISQPSLIPILDQIAGETKLANAIETAPYRLSLPTYPSELGQPDHVYVQDAEGVMTVLVWVDPKQPEHVIMSLHFIPTGHWAINKMGPRVIQETRVNGNDAIWAEGPYPLFMQNGEITFTRLIDGNVLIWADSDVTYRLETDLSLEDAIKIAESLKPTP